MRYQVILEKIAQTVLACSVSKGYPLYRILASGIHVLSELKKETESPDVALINKKSIRATLFRLNNKLTDQQKYDNDIESGERPPIR